MAYREACKHLFISLGLWHTIGEKRFQAQKGKEHIKTARSQYWDLILSGFTKSPQDTITSFFTQPVRGSCSQSLTSTAWLLQGMTLPVFYTPKATIHAEVHQVHGTGTQKLLWCWPRHRCRGSTFERQAVSIWWLSNQAALLWRDDFTTQAKAAE